MAEQLLREEAIYPSEELLSIALGGVYPAYQSFCELFAAEQIAMEWRYYNDGRSWLCKCQHKKKTVFWLSIWEGFFKTAFFFPERLREDLLALPTEQPLAFERNVGKSVPVVMELRDKSQLGDFMRLAEYKKSLK